MAYYKFSIIEYRLMQDGDEKYIDHIKELPNLIINDNNYISATLKAQKKYPSEKYIHRLIDTDSENWPKDTKPF